MEHKRSHELAGHIGAILDNEKAEDVGEALAIVLGTFISVLVKDADGIEGGIDAIAADAKNFATMVVSHGHAKPH